MVQLEAACCSFSRNGAGPERGAGGLPVPTAQHRVQRANPKFSFNPDTSALSKKRSLIPAVSHRLPAHCPSLQLESHRAQLVCDFPLGLFPSLVWAGAPQQPGMEEWKCSDKTLHNFTQKTHTHFRPQSPNPQMEFKPRAPRQTKVHRHKLPMEAEQQLP